MKIKKERLLLIAGFVWSIAGGNILFIGLNTYAEYISIRNGALTLIVFFLFWLLVFKKLTRKHTKRIREYPDEKQFFWLFFDKKSFIIMFFMMTFGIVIRTQHLLPNQFIAVFYTGLGTALLLAGIIFLKNYIREQRSLKG
ncbi:hypothetical protein RV11_GL002726 [Enterococcus phoeniculicola]|jgi:hypothetical protein|uniref:Transmembrane protein n=1 Tax=Enterococcus phoeniculicola ATCC BAA-412 TaxID=1158610 RepID=R3TL16_9ENTE|nr:hypothetical protein [Enterococcus phoeniculicola]EOL41748.1 hypothetical protein UC3_03313 [Enterococcus phoeniculicola ATCC BAA-412]EOT78758.1 hypothetical protein I589_00263 [Enterococcus phoeniculicola ATCC BAA-412]OJG72587.1 hypothetical protein RV11_GL002726 [Enterococcus phoeniculicola]